MLVNRFLSQRSRPRDHGLDNNRNDDEDDHLDASNHTSRVMATLLNYGFTATSRSPKGSQEQQPAARVAQASQADSDTSKNPPYIGPADSRLPPIPISAAISIPQLETGLKRRSPAVPPPNKNKSLPLPPPPNRTAPQPPPSPARPSSSGADEKVTVVPSSPVVAATLFPPPMSPSVSVPRGPSKGLYGSSDRIQQILRAKKIGDLNVGANHGSGEKGARRSSSVGVTPVSAYAGKENRKPKLSVNINVNVNVESALESDMAITPIEMDLGSLEVIASLPDNTTRRPRKKSVTTIPLPRSRYNTKSRDSVVTVELPGGSLMTVITPEQSAWQRAPYVPGTVRLEPNTKTDRSPLAIIQETVEAELGLDKEKLAAEHAILDELVSFIESFGDEFTVENTGMDAFWVESPLLRPPRLDRGYLSPPLSVASTLVQSPSGAKGVPRFSTSAEGTDRYGDLHEPDFLHDLPTPSLKRASLASSQHSGSSRTRTNTPNSLTAYSPPPAKYTSPMGSPRSSQLGVPASAMAVAPARKVRHVKGKGPTSGGQKMSFRGMLRSAASIV